MRTLATLLLATLMSSTPTTPTGQPGPMQPSDYTPAAQSRVVSWQLKRVVPPSPLYVSVDDKLVVGAASSQVNEVVTVNYRLLRAADGVIVPGQFTVAPANTRAIAVQQQQLAEGFLLSVSVKAAAATTRGQTFLRAFLGAGAFGAGEPSYMLMADYVTTAMAPAHPNGRVLAPSEGPGNIRLLTVSSPPVVTDWSVTVPTNARWRVISVYGQLATDGTVGNRDFQLRVQPDGVTKTWNTDSAAIPASKTALVNASSGINDVLVTGGGGALLNFNTALPETLMLLAGGTIKTSTNFQGVADQWSAIALEVEEWLDNV